MTNEELEIIIKYEVNKVIDKLIKYSKEYDCTNHMDKCRANGKTEDECKGAQATAQVIIGKMENWELYASL